MSSFDPKNKPSVEIEILEEFDNKIEQKNNPTDRSSNTRLTQIIARWVAGCWLLGDKLQNKFANFLPCLVLTG